ncbi:MAG: 3-hydroxyacyl-CoA dehydrogenase NAD-binding domain-containing protein [Pseudomonadota bacterium]
MADVVSYSRDGDIAVVTINNPPVNALSHAVRQGIQDGVRAFMADADAKALVLHCEGRTFLAGADISEFGKPPKEPGLSALCAEIEDCSKPVIAALHGTPLGGGLEVALGAHYRVAQKGTRVGLPEVLLGILPGAGGTQRLPRVAGAENALEMITTGRHVPAEEALSKGIVDAIDESGDPLAAGLAFAKTVVAEGKGVRRTRDLTVDASPELFAEWEKKVAKTAKGQKSPIWCVKAVAASTMPIADGLKRERELFQEVHDDPQRAALVHAFFSERAVAKVPEAKAEPRKLETVGILGAGTMGAGIAAACLQNGLKVVTVEMDPEGLKRGEANIRRNFASSVAKGRMTQEALDALLADNWSGATELEAFAEIDLLIEAVFETMQIKKDVFSKVDKIVREGAVLASNTSYLDIDEIASVTNRPQDVIGLHFFSPAHIMRLLEVIVGEKSDPTAVATGFALARKLKKVGVRCGVCDGFIGNRILANYMKAANMMVEDGASPYEVDAAVREFGYPMGPFQMGDLAGLDIGYLSRKDRAATRDPADRHPYGFLDRMYEEGWIGQKVGKGFYDYSENPRSGPPNPGVLPMIEEERRKLQINAKPFTKEEIMRRYIAAMVNEAAKVVEEGIALRPLDVDMASLFGYGHPRWRGGPMHYADHVGLDKILADIKEFEKDDPRFWKPAALLEKLVAEGRKFGDLNNA